MTNAIGSATTGLLAATGRFAAGATRVAAAPSGGPGGAVEAAVGLAAKTDLSIQTAMLRQANEIQKRVLDILV
ncbi:hypothetical protein [Methylobacterium sp. ID0610]|uniref:hypothetical protein n=1 Tax=Methylobacterium carpenticola TaxID=3344827 RepID=UPI0036920F16